MAKKTVAYDSVGRPFYYNNDKTRTFINPSTGRMFRTRQEVYDYYKNDPTKRLDKTYLQDGTYVKTNPNNRATPRNNGLYASQMLSPNSVNPMYADQQALANLGQTAYNKLVDAQRWFTTMPAITAASDLMSSLVNRAARKITKKEDYTPFRPKVRRENGIPTEVQQEIAKQAEWAIDNNLKIRGAGGRQQYFLQHPNDTLYIPFNANQYYMDTRGVRYGNDRGHYSPTDNIIGWTPEKNVEHTLGRFGIYLDRNGYNVRDTYDFNEGSGNYTNPQNLYEWGRKFMQDHGSQENEPDEQKIHYNYRFDF